MKHKEPNGCADSGADNSANPALVAEVYHECFRALVSDEYTPDEAADYLQQLPVFANVLEAPIRLRGGFIG